MGPGKEVDDGEKAMPAKQSEHHGADKKTDHREDDQNELSESFARIKVST